ncbi:hypothetical protein C2W64_04179 [Brevibacillus laterosporus]|nr:hypothetical protein C2W64_04179 [Brevibacillus laterosporus]
MEKMISPLVMREVIFFISIRYQYQIIEPLMAKATRFLRYHIQRSEN